LVGGIDHVDGVVVEAAEGCLQGHAGQDVATQREIACGAGQSQGLDVVALGRCVLAVVEGGPPGQACQLRGRGEQSAAGGVVVAAVQQRRRAFLEAGGDRRGAPVAAAVAGVPAAGIFGGGEQLVDVAVPDLAERLGGLGGGVVVGGGGQPPAKGHGVRADRHR
jgi:hypothetical protein